MGAEISIGLPKPRNRVEFGLWSLEALAERVSRPWGKAS